MTTLSAAEIAALLAITDPTAHDRVARLLDTLAARDAEIERLTALIQKAGEIGYTYGALGRDYAFVYRDVAALTEPTKET